jgi:hypothetical protein
MRYWDWDWNFLWDRSCEYECHCCSSQYQDSRQIEFKFQNQSSWFNFNMNHLLKSLLCIERDDCCGSLDYSQSAHIASASSSVASSNDISNKLSQAHENGRYSS